MKALEKAAPGRWGLAQAFLAWVENDLALSGTIRKAGVLLAVTQEGKTLWVQKLPKDFPLERDPEEGFTPGPENLHLLVLGVSGPEVRNTEVAFPLVKGWRAVFRHDKQGWSWHLLDAQGREAARKACPRLEETFSFCLEELGKAAQAAMGV